MRDLLTSLRSAVRRNRGSASKRSKRIGVFGAVIGAAVLVGGLLQSASASSLAQTELVGTSTTVESSSTNNTSVVGEQVTYTATVTADVGTAAGTVDFLDGDQPISGCTDVVLDASGEAACDQTYSATGTHTIKAEFTDNTLVFEDSTSAPITQTVNAADTTTTLVSDNGTPVTGESVTFTATVAATPPGSGTPTGTVTFNDGTSDISACLNVTLDGSAQAQCTTSFLASGSPYTVKATFTPGDGNYNTSNGSIQQTVAPADTQTQLQSETNPTVTGQSTKFTATLSAVLPGTGTPTGKVTFNDGTSDIGSCTLVDLDGSGSAECTASFAAVGSPYNVKATYSSVDGNYNSSFGTVNQTVNPAATTTTLLSADNSTVTGESVTFTASISADLPGTGTPTGTVTFNDGTSDISACLNVTLDGSAQAQCTTSFPASGSPYTVKATFTPGDGNYSTSFGTVAQTVSRANTTTGIGSSDLNPTTGQPVTYTAVVAAVLPGIGTPTGNVAFKDGGVDIPSCASVALTSGQAQCSQTYSSTGNHVITAAYLSDSNFATSSSSSISEVIGFAYLLKATANSSSDPSQASFKISNGPPLNYTLCVKYSDPWPAVTPPPSQKGYGINLSNKCKDIGWGSSGSDTVDLWPTFGFATRGTYTVTWKTRSGVQIGTDSFDWNSWCPPGPTSARQLGVWRTSRHKVIDSCSITTGKVYKGRSSPNSLDGDEAWGFDDGTKLHMEFVKRDWSSSYGAPSTGALGKMNPKGTVTTAGVRLCDTYHGHREKHPIFMVKMGDKIWLGGAQYSTKTPSVSGSWSAHAC